MAIYYLIAFLLSFCIVYFYRRWALRNDLLDIPNERSLHEKPIPTGGGIAIIITFYVLLFHSYLAGQLEKNLFFALIPGIALAVLGFVDDFKKLSPFIRISVQIICSGIALYFLGGFDGFFGENLKWFWTIIALFGFVWFINLFNFLDGSDGYSSMETVSIVLVLWYFTGLDIFLMLGFSVGGFLYWNWPKARIFMGDVGSITLGFILIVFGVYLHNKLILNFSFWLIITSLFWFDATITLFRRLLNKEKLIQGHKKHVYQRAIQSGFSHLRVLLTGFLINVLLFIICLAIESKFCNLVIGLLMVLVILLTALKYIDRKIPFSSKQ
jgi:UDP-N-acetylmuramyl pentapeptide phosphotransferase/UDP-N-acetylglucosamine-1-phosphate transferase